MPAIRFLAVALFVFQLDVSASAAGLIRQLPRDGEWVRYQWSVSNGTGGPDQSAGTLTISSVGNAVSNGQMCRWLELKLIYEEGAVKHAFFTKWLVPEKDINAETDFTQLALQTWLKVDDAQAVQRLAPADAPQWLHRIQPVFRDIFKSLPDAGKLDDKAVDYQHGKLACTGFKQATVGNATKVTINGTPAELTTKSVRSLWLHKDVPFGVASCENERTSLRNGESNSMEVVRFSLSDFGSEAKTEVATQN